MNILYCSFKYIFITFSPKTTKFTIFEKKKHYKVVLNATKNRSRNKEI